MMRWILGIVTSSGERTSLKAIDFVRQRSGRSNRHRAGAVQDRGCSETR